MDTALRPDVCFRPQPAVAKGGLRRHAAVGLRPPVDSKRADENTMIFLPTESVRDGYFTFRGWCRALLSLIDPQRSVDPT
jgi:hypothetical protein